MKKIIFIFTVFIIISCTQKTDSLNSHSYENQMNDINQQVIQEALQQYRITEKSGDLMEIYSATSLVKEAYKQANDEENYLIWLRKEKQISRQLGLE